MGFRTRITDAFRTTVPPALAPPDHFDQADVAVMLREIGIAMVEVSAPVQLVEERLRQIAARYTTARVQVAVLPTMLLIQVGTSHEMEGSAQPSGQLDMAARIDEIAGLAGAGAISPRDAVDAVHAARNQRSRFGPVATTLGYGLTTVGFGMVIDATWKALLAHLFLGLVVGLIIQISRPFPSLTPILPTLSAVVVTLLATWFVADVADDGLLRQVPVHGSSTPMGAWSLYASIVVIAVGLYFYLSAPRGSLLWLLLIIAVAMLAQTVAGFVMNSAHSGFIGAMVAIPLAMLASRVRGAPPASVLALAAFWSLVPGQLTFMSLSRSASGDVAGIASVSVAGAAILSIALGTLAGWSLVRTLPRAQRPPAPVAA